MTLSIIIVTWNTQALLKKCLHSILINQDNLDLEIFVVDNNSSDNTVKMVKQDFSQVNLIANKNNLGFAAANNQAIQKARGEYILLLNPDTEILGQTLQKCLHFFQQTQDCGVLGCQVLNPDKSIQPSVRRFPNWKPLLLILLKIPKLFPNLKILDHYLAKDFNYAKTQNVDQVMGAFFMTKKSIFNQLGELDENFFIWFEEVDFCKRVQQNGYQVYYYADAQIIHHGGQSFTQQTLVANQTRFFNSAWYYLKKHGFNGKR